ncbi:MAG TPA: hypothetical protein VMZ91_05170 [Candidatus Paceibacterota bacterium]|nr:hypothetical protein [Candidatus Paceibacterota bacterium]
MKTLNETFEEKEFKEMKRFKNGLSWHDFIILIFNHCLDAQKKGDFEIFKKEK